MRIRLRVPSDDEGKSEGVRDWFQRLRGLFSGATAARNGPLFQMCQRDKRWISHGALRYFFEGRRCRFIEDAWQSEYVFSVVADGELRRIRVVLPESPIGSWERRHDQRMPEEERLRLALQTMIALADKNRFPEEVKVPEDAITTTTVS